jgi:hypothetical protein
MGAAGSAVAIIFGIFWTIMASGMGAPIFFPLFGLVFIGFGLVQFIYHMKNASGKNRMSIVDITEDGEEEDPLEDLFGIDRDEYPANHRDLKGEAFAFCPYCGQKLDKSYRFCPACGKQIAE